MEPKPSQEEVTRLNTLGRLYMHALDHGLFYAALNHVETARDLLKEISLRVYEEA